MKATGKPRGGSNEQLDAMLAKAEMLAMQMSAASVNSDEDSSSLLASPSRSRGAVGEQRQNQHQYSQQRGQLQGNSFWNGSNLTAAVAAAAAGQSPKAENSMSRLALSTENHLVRGATNGRSDAADEPEDFLEMMRKAEAMEKKMRAAAGGLPQQNGSPQRYSAQTDLAATDDNHSAFLSPASKLTGFGSFFNGENVSTDDDVSMDEMLRKAELLARTMSSSSSSASSGTARGSVSRVLPFETESPSTTATSSSSPPSLPHDSSNASFTEQQLHLQTQLALKSLNSDSSTGADTEECVATVQRSNSVRPPRGDKSVQSGGSAVSESLEHVAKAEELTRLMQQTLHAYDGDADKNANGKAVINPTTRVAHDVDRTIAALQQHRGGNGGTPTSVSIQNTSLDQDDISSVGSGSAMSFHIRHQASSYSRRSYMNQLDGDNGGLFGSFPPLSPQNEIDLRGTPSPKQKQPTMKRSLPSMASTHAMSTVTNDTRESSPSDRIKWEKMDNASSDDDDYVPLVDYSKTSTNNRQLSYDDGSSSMTSTNSAPRRLGGRKRPKPLLTKRQAKRILRRVLRTVAVLVILRCALLWFWPTTTTKSSTEPLVHGKPSKTDTMSKNTTDLDQQDIPIVGTTEPFLSALDNKEVVNTTDTATATPTRDATNDGVDPSGAPKPSLDAGNMEQEKEDAPPKDEEGMDEPITLEPVHEETDDNNDNKVTDDVHNEDVDEDDDDGPIVITQEEIDAYLAEMGEDLDDDVNDEEHDMLNDDDDDKASELALEKDESEPVVSNDNDNKNDVEDIDALADETTVDSRLSSAPIAPEEPLASVRANASAQLPPLDQQGKYQHVHPKQCWIPFVHVMSGACQQSMMQKPLFDAEQLVRSMMQ